MKQHKFVYKNMTNIIVETTSFDLNIYQAGEERCASSHFFGPAVRQHYLFHYILGGQGEYYYKNKVYNLKKGEGFLIHPNDVTTYKASKNNPWHYVWIEFDGLNFINELKKIGLSEETPIYKPKNYDENCEESYYFKKIVKNDNTNLSIVGLTYLLLNALEKNTSAKKQKSKENKSLEYVNQAIEFIKRRYHDNITVEDIAYHCNINRSYLGTLFQENLNISTQNYLLNYRMKIAINLLKDKNLPIKAVSISVGYKNQLHFSQAFKNLYGKSPTDYRNLKSN